MLWPSHSERGGFGTELKCFRGCGTDLGKMGSSYVPWTHLSSLQELTPCYRLGWAMKLLTRDHLAPCRSVLHAVIQAERPRAPNSNIGAVRFIHQPETSLLLPPHSMSHHSGMGFRSGPCPCFCATRFQLSQSLHLPLAFLLSFALCFSPCESYLHMPLTLLPETSAQAEEWPQGHLRFSPSSCE